LILSVIIVRLFLRAVETNELSAVALRAF